MASSWDFTAFEAKESFETFSLPRPSSLATCWVLEAGAELCVGVSQRHVGLCIGANGGMYREIVPMWAVLGGSHEAFLVGWSLLCKIEAGL